MEVLEPPQDAVVRTEGLAHFTCVLSEAVPVGEATWYINGAAVQPDDADWTVTADGSHHALLLRRARPQHAGEVTFAARDAVASARLTVLGGCLAHLLPLGGRALLWVCRGGRFQPQRLLGALCVSTRGVGWDAQCPCGRHTSSFPETVGSGHGRPQA